MNTPAIVTKLLLSAAPSNSGKSLYFHFSEPTDSSEIIAVAHGKNYCADFTSDTFVELIGKKALFDTAVFRE